MKNNKKCLSVLSTAAMGTLIATALASGVSAKTTDVVVKLDGKNVKFNFEELNKSYEDKILVGNAPLYDAFAKNEEIVSLLDDKAGYVDYKAVARANEDAVIDGKPFGLDTFTEAAKGEQILPEVKVDAEWKDGAVTPIDGQLKVESVSAITDSKLSVKLSTAIDEAKAENFKVEGLTVNSATLIENKKEVVLDVTGLEVKKEYTVKATGLKVNGKVIDELNYKFVMPDAGQLFTPEVTMKDTVLKADGLSTTLVTFTLKDANGNVMKDADKVEVAFSTTFGRFAENRVTVQNGVATVLLNSETLTSKKTANITATVLEASNKNLIGLEAKRSILMDPSPKFGDDDQKLGATMTEVQAAQADRVIVYFDKEVSVEKYVKEGTYELNPDKATAQIWTEVPNSGIGGKEVHVKGILPVQENKNALQLLLDVENGEYLTDNSNVKAKFVDKTGTLEVPSTKDCKLTDARRPSMLSVAREGLKTLKVTFSEPVEPGTANKPENWTIDGYQLSDIAAYGTGAKVEVGSFDTAAKRDTRNVVTITLGEDTNGNQIYFKSGTHSIQGSSIGDWANLKDINNNVMNTQTLDFDIPSDDIGPKATVEVQSPEQYIVKFDKEVTGVSGTIESKIELQKYDKVAKAWKKETKQQIRVTSIGHDTNEYKVEVTKDWTHKDVYDTESTKLNYHNDSYRLVIAKDSVVAAINGAKNIETELPLGGAMLIPDTTSPVISAIEEVKDTKGAVTNYKVTMSEPVKGFDGLVTPEKDTTPEVTPTAQFIKKDGSRTVPGVVTVGTDFYDKEITVTPHETLGAGQWTLVVRSISDDIGNTAASATKDFEVKSDEVITDNFAVKWAFADVDGDVNPTTVNIKPDTAHDYVYVKFNKEVSITGDAKNALKTSNFQFDGMPLPTGTQIRANISGYDDKDAVTDSITIALPEGTLGGKNEPHVLTISSYLESTTAGDILTNGGVKTLTWTADNSELNIVSDMAQAIVGSNAKVEGTTVTVINKNAKLVDLITIKNLNITNLNSIVVNGTDIFASKDPAAVKTALSAALSNKAVENITLGDLVGTIKVNGVDYIVK